MTMKKRAIVDASILLVLFATLCFNVCNRGRLLPHKEGEALLVVGEICVAVMAHYRVYPQIKILGDAPYGQITAQKIMIQIGADGMPVKFDESKDAKRKTFIEWQEIKDGTDPWGNPYWVAWNKKDGGELPFDIYVWSAGPDGINEFGQGDDFWSLNASKMTWPKSKSPTSQKLDKYNN